MKTPLREPSLTGNEKELVLGYLSFQQQVFIRKIHNEHGDLLSDEVLSKALPPSTMTLKGMIAHLWFVEDYWRQEVLLGQNLPQPWQSMDWDTDPDADWHIRLPTPQCVTHLQDSMQATHRLLEASNWDQLSTGKLKDGTRFSYRWVALHLVEEWGRHLGHADLLRENIDGTVGD
ncbi:DUF664 domain-containing protein [Rothia sp. CCM 9417]|uniref:mycothiol transferase n=1 Tax=unclassified Rothia (in: high G+C Gram-positive bacteria) TaxID=2689056 RepID=UPI003AE7AA20